MYANNKHNPEIFAVFLFLNSEFFHLFFHSYVLYTYIYILIYIYSKSKQTLCLSDCGKICEQLY